MRTIMILPILVPPVAIGSMWKLMYNYDFGVFNQALVALGASPVNWLGSTSVALAAVILVDVWHWVPFVFLILFAAVEGIPSDVIEAARIDGASNWRIYWQLMLPLSGPVIAIVSIYTFLASWNDFLNPLIYLNSPHNRTLALALNAFRGQYGVSDAHLLMAAAVVCMLPCVILFFAAQKYFVESVAMTGLKS